jgi:tyrosyl-tRNA synthetase
VANVTNKDKIGKFIKDKQAAYIGFDPSFDSLHLGNYVMVLLLRRLVKCGHKAYAIIGGATGLIGDPSGKKNERDLKSADEISNNLNAIKSEIIKYGNCEVINNFDIYKSINFLDFLRQIGKNINVNYLLEKDIIKRRLETGISYAEFSYTLIQAYDFY